MRELAMRILDWLRRDRLSAELSDELRFHQEHLEHHARASGLGTTEAYFAARRRLGNVTLARENAREHWSLPWLDRFQQDVRYAVRGLRRSPGFTATVVATLGLGIGANAAMFGAVDRLMFRPPPYLHDPAMVHRVYLQTTVRGRVSANAVMPYTRYLDLRKATSSFSQYAAISQNTWAVGSGDAVREQSVASVSASFFDFFDARPALGRFFDATEDVVPRGAAVAVLDYGYWSRELGARNVIGQSIQLGAISYEIIGVAPKGFVGVSADRPPAAYVPITTVAANESPSNLNVYYTNYRWDFTSVIVRRRPGVTVDAASVDLTQAFVKSRDAARIQMPSVAPATVAQPMAIAGPIKTAAGPGASLESKTLLWVTGVAVIVLLIACANVTNLMFARILSRRREIAMRLALGVSRRRLATQILTESLLLAMAGCVAGVLVAQWAGGALRVLVLPKGVDGSVATDWRTLGVAAGCALVAGTLIAIGPALLAGRGNLAEALRAGARGGTYQRSHMRSALLVLQGALSVVLLVGAGLFVRSLGNVRDVRLGYDAERVLIAFLNMRGAQMDSGARVQFQRTFMESALTIPGVEDVAMIDSRPFSTSTVPLFVDGIDSVQTLGRFDIQRTTPGYFDVMSTRIIKGRAFTAADRAGTPRVTVVSDAMARALWPGKEATGQCIRLGADTAPCTTVVGVAEDAAYESFTDDRRFLQYVPQDQWGPAGSNKMLLRVKGPYADAAIERVRRGLQRAMPSNGYVAVQPFEELVDAERRSWALGATLFVAFGALALIVAAVGLYGVIAYNVAQRMQELSIRIALGAQRQDIVRLVVGQGVSFAVAGVTIGLVAALLAARWIQPLLFHQSAMDPLTYGAVGAIIVLVALTASATPAWRATRADPNAALRSD
jgi:putative ABC transport system permease protein